MLRARRERPRRRAAQHRDELAASAHSITSSASASSVGGRVRPNALAMLRLMTKSNFTVARHRCAVAARPHGHGLPDRRDIPAAYGDGGGSPWHILLRLRWRSSNFAHQSLVANFQFPCSDLRDLVRSRVRPVRGEMQAVYPELLITNHSMLEYTFERPNSPCAGNCQGTAQNLQPHCVRKRKSCLI